MAVSLCGMVADAWIFASLSLDGKAVVITSRPQRSTRSCSDTRKAREISSLDGHPTRSNGRRAAETLATQHSSCVPEAVAVRLLLGNHSSGVPEAVAVRVLLGSVLHGYMCCMGACV